VRRTTIKESCRPFRCAESKTGIALQSKDHDFVLLATGGFGAHFNTTRTAHRELVHRHLEARGAIFERADSVDLLSSNTVEDIAMVAAFADSRASTLTTWSHPPSTPHAVNSLYRASRQITM
jgi:hypothetical protein